MHRSALILGLLALACRGDFDGDDGSTQGTGDSSDGAAGTSSGDTSDDTGATDGSGTGGGSGSGTGTGELPTQECGSGGQVGFDAAITVTTAGEPGRVRAGQFGQGGGEDVFALSFTEASIRMLWGNGNALFPEEPDQDVLFNDALALDFAVAELTGDSALDLVMPVEDWNDQSHALRIYEGDGNGTFGPIDMPVFTEYPLTGLGFAIVLADIVGDASLDAVVAFSREAEGGVEVLDGGNGWQSAHVETGLGIEPWALATGDMDGDGALDIVVADTDELNEGQGDDLVFVLRNDGNGAFPVWDQQAALANPRELALDDLDGDGALDVVLAPEQTQNPASEIGVVEVFYGDGAGNLDTPSRTIEAGHTPSAVFVGDLNCDDVPDIAVGNRGDNAVGVLWGVGGDAYAPMQSHPVGGQPTASLESADFNDDGIPDLVIPNWDGSSVSVLIGSD